MTEPRSDGGIRGKALVLIGAGVVLNEFVLAVLLSPDAHVGSPWFAWGIRGLQLACIVLGGIIALRPAGRVASMCTSLVRGISANRRLHLVLFGALLIVYLLLAYCALDRGSSWGDDYAHYIMQARSIVQGNARKFARQQRENKLKYGGDFPPRVALVPWGYPLLMAPVYALAGLELMAYKYITIVFYLALLIALIFFWRREHGTVHVLLVVAFFAFNPYMITFHNNLRTAVPFMAFTTFAVLMIGRTVVRGQPLVSRRADPFILGGVTFCAFLIRENGLFVLPALLVAQVGSAFYDSKRGEWLLSFPSQWNVSWRPQWLRSLGRAAIPYAVFALLATLLSLLSPAGAVRELKEGWFSPDFALVQQNLAYYFQLPRELYESVQFPSIVYGLSLALAAIGAVHAFDRDYPMVVFGGLTVALYVFRPTGSTQGLRYIMPVLPFYVHFVLVGLRCLWEKQPGIRGTVLHAGSIMALVIVGLLMAKTSVGFARWNMGRDREAHSGPASEPARELFTYVRTNVPEDRVLSFFKPRLMRLLTHRLCLRINECTDLADVDYVVVHKEISDRGQIPPDGLERCTRSNHLREVFENELFVVFRHRRDAEK